MRSSFLPLFDGALRELVRNVHLLVGGVDRFLAAIQFGGRGSLADRLIEQRLRLAEIGPLVFRFLDEVVFAEM